MEEGKKVGKKMVVDKFTVTGKITGALYYLQPHHLTQMLDCSPYACALFRPKNKTLFSIVLVPWKRFPWREQIVYISKIVLVSPEGTWIGCVGIAEYDGDYAVGDIENLLNVEKYFSIVPIDHPAYRAEEWQVAQIGEILAEPKKEEKAVEAPKEEEVVPAALIYPLVAAPEEASASESDLVSFGDNEFMATDEYPLRDKDVEEDEILFIEGVKYPLPSNFHRFAHLELKKKKISEEVMDALFGEDEDDDPTGSESLKIKLEARGLLSEILAAREEQNKWIEVKGSSRREVPALWKMRSDRFTYFSSIGESIFLNIPWGRENLKLKVDAETSDPGSAILETCIYYVSAALLSGKAPKEWKWRRGDVEIDADTFRAFLTSNTIPPSIANLINPDDDKMEAVRALLRG